ncbi:uncharacterized protein LOC144910641 isoform X1 [Branchiostoma floridae x Branchiostoma belcheri]
MADVTWYMSESAEAVAEELSRLLSSLEGRDDDEDVAEQYLDKFREIVDAHLPEGPVTGMEEGIAVIQAAVEKFVQARQNFNEGQACMQWLASSLATLSAQYVVDLNYQQLPVEAKVKFVATISMANELLQPFGHEDFLEVLLAARQPWHPVFLKIMKGKATDMSEVDVYLSREPSLLMEYRVRSLHAHGAVDDASMLAQSCMNHPSHRDTLFFREMFLLCQWQAGKVDNIKRQVQFIECVKLYFIVQHYVAEGMLELAATVSSSYLIYQWKKGEYCCNKELVRQWCQIQHAVESPANTILDSARTLAFKNDPKVLHLLYFAEALHKEVGKDSMPLVADLLLRAVDMDKPVTDPFFHPNAPDDKTAYHHSAPTILNYMAGLLEGDYEIRFASELTSFSISPDLDQYYLVEAVANLPEEVQGTGVNLSRHKRRDILKTLRKLRPRSCGLHPEMSWQQLKPHMLKLLTSQERNKLLQEHIEAACDISAFDEEVGKSPCKATVSKPRLTEKEPVCNMSESDDEDMVVFISDSDEGSCGPISPIYSGARYGLDFITPPRPPRASSIVDNVAKDSPFVGKEEVIICENGDASPENRDKRKQKVCMEEESSVSQDGWLESVENDTDRSTPGGTGVVSVDKMVDTDDLMGRIIKDQEEAVAASKNSSVLSNGFDESRHQKDSSQANYRKQNPAGQGARKSHNSCRHVTLRDLLWRTNPEDFDFTTKTGEEAVSAISVSPTEGGCGKWQQPVDREDQSINHACTETLDINGSVESTPSNVVRVGRMEELQPKYGGTLREWEGLVPPDPLNNYTHSTDQSVEIMSHRSPEKGDMFDFNLSGDLMAENGSADSLKIKVADLVDSMDQGGSCGPVFLVDLGTSSTPDNTVAAAELRMAAQHGHQKSTHDSVEAGGAPNGSNRLQNTSLSRKNIFEAIAGTANDTTRRHDGGPFLLPSSKGETEVPKAKRRPSKLSLQQVQRELDAFDRSSLLRLQDHPDFMQTVAPAHSFHPTLNSWNSSASSLSSRGDTASSHEGYDGSSECSTETGETTGAGLFPIQGASKQQRMQRNAWTAFGFEQNDITQGAGGRERLISNAKKKAGLEPAELNNRSLGMGDKKSAPTAKPLQFNKLRQMLMSDSKETVPEYGQERYTDQSGTMRLSEEHTDKTGHSDMSPLKHQSERTIGVNTDDARNTDLGYMMRKDESFSLSLPDSDSRINQVTEVKGIPENITSEELLRIPQPMLTTKRRGKGLIGVRPVSIKRHENYACNCCEFHTRYLSNIKRHMVRHGDDSNCYTRDISYVCQFCQFSRSTRKELIAHMTSTHQHSFQDSWTLDPWTTDMASRHAEAAELAMTEDSFVAQEEISFDHHSLANSRDAFVAMSDISVAEVNESKSKVGTKKRKGKCPKNLAEIRKKTCAELAAKGIPHLEDTTNTFKDSGIQKRQELETMTVENYQESDNSALMMPVPSRNDVITCTGNILTLRPTQQLPQTAFCNFSSSKEEDFTTLLLQPSRDAMLALPRELPEVPDLKRNGGASTNKIPMFSHHGFSPPEIRMSPIVSPPVMSVLSPPTTFSPTANTSPPKGSSHVSPSRSKDENQNFAPSTLKPASKKEGKKDYKATFLYSLLTEKDETENVSKSPGTDPLKESRSHESLVPPLLFPQDTEVPAAVMQSMSPPSLLPQTAFAANIPNSYNFATTFSPYQIGLQPPVGCYNVSSLPLVGTPQLYDRNEGHFVPVQKKTRSRKEKNSNSRKQGAPIVSAAIPPTFLNIPRHAKYSPVSHVPHSSPLPSSHTGISTFRPSPSQGKAGNRRWTHDQHSPYRSGLPDVQPYGEPGELWWQSQAYWWNSPQPGTNPAHTRSKPPKTSRSPARPKSHTVTTNEMQPLDLRTTSSTRSSPSANHVWASHYVRTDNDTVGLPIGQSQRQPVQSNGTASSPMSIDQVSLSHQEQSEGCPPPTQDVQIQESEHEGQSPAGKPLSVPYIPVHEHHTFTNDVTVMGNGRSTVSKGSSSLQSGELSSMAATLEKTKENCGSVEHNETTGVTCKNAAVEVRQGDLVDRQESHNLTLEMAASWNEANIVVTCNDAGNIKVAGDSGAPENTTEHVGGSCELHDTKEANVGGLSARKAPEDTEPAHIPSGHPESSGSVASDRVLKLFSYADNFSDDDVLVPDSQLTSWLNMNEGYDADKAANEIEPTQSPSTNDEPSVHDVIPSSEVQLTQSYISSEESSSAESRKTATDTVAVHGPLTYDQDSYVDAAVVEMDDTFKSDSSSDVQPLYTHKSESDHTSINEAIQACKAEPKWTSNIETFKIEPEHTCNGELQHSCKTEPEDTWNVEPAHSCKAELKHTCGNLDTQDATENSIARPVSDTSTDGKDTAVIGDSQAVLNGKQSTSTKGENLCSVPLPQGKTPTAGRPTSPEPDPTTEDDEPSIHYTGHEQAETNSTGYRGPMTRKRMSSDAIPSSNNSSEQRKKLKTSQDETEISVEAEGENSKSKIPSMVSTTPTVIKEEPVLPSLESLERNKPLKGQLMSTEEKSGRKGKARKILRKSVSAGRKKGASPTVSNKTVETAAVSGDTLTSEVSGEGLTSQQREESVTSEESVGLGLCTNVKGSKDTKSAELLESDASHDSCVTPQNTSGRKEKTSKRSPKHRSVGRMKVEESSFSSSKEELGTTNELVRKASKEDASSHTQELEDLTPTETNVSAEPSESKGDLQSLVICSQNNLVPKENAKQGQKKGRYTGRKSRAESGPKEKTALTDKESGNNVSEEDSSTREASVDRTEEEKVSSSLGNSMKKSTSLKSKTKPLSPCTDKPATSEASKSKGSLQKSPAIKEGKKVKTSKSQQKGRRVAEKKLEHPASSSEEKPNLGTTDEFASQTSEDDTLAPKGRPLGGGEPYKLKKKAPSVQGKTIRRRVARQRMMQNSWSSAEEDTGSEIMRNEQPSSTAQEKFEMTKQTVKRQQKTKGGSTGRRKVTDSKVSSPDTVLTVSPEHESKSSQDTTFSQPLEVSTHCDETSNLTGSTGAETPALSPGTGTTSGEVVTLEGGKPQKKSKPRLLVIENSAKATGAPRRSYRKRVPSCKIMGKTVVVYSKVRSHTSEESSREESDDSHVSFNPPSTRWTYSREDKKKYQEKSVLTQESEVKGTETIDHPSSESVELEMPKLEEQNMNPVDDNIPHSKPSETQVVEKGTTRRRLRSGSPTGVSVTGATGETKANIADPSLIEQVAAEPSSVTSEKPMATRQRRKSSISDTLKSLSPEKSSVPFPGGTKRKTPNNKTNGPASPKNGKKVAASVMNSATGRASGKSAKSKQHCAAVPTDGKKSRKNQTSGNNKSLKKPTPSSATKSTGVKTKVKKGKQEAAPQKKKSTGVPKRLLVTKAKLPPKSSKPKKK